MSRRKCSDCSKPLGGTRGKCFECGGPSVCYRAGEREDNTLWQALAGILG